MRRRLIAGNWKMNLTAAEGAALAAAVVRGLREAGLGVPPVAQRRPPEVAVMPPFTALAAVAQAVRGSDVSLGAQNVHWEERGAFTGEVAAPMLRDLGCRYVIVGHSERRHIMGETDDMTKKKVRAVLAAGLEPILCVGETLAERDAGLTEPTIGRQLDAALDGLGGDDASRAATLVVAYEPVWAIGTGRAAHPDDAGRVLAFIRGRLGRLLGAAAPTARVLYGGSVKPGNAAAFFAGAGFDGALVGGASLEAGSFCAIAGAAV